MKKINPKLEIIPEQLQAEMKRIGLTAIEIISSNQRKGRWVLKVQQQVVNLPAVLKWCHPAMEKKQKYAFKCEQDFYSRYCYKSFLPRPIQWAPDSLLLEYVPSVSLRQYMVDKVRGNGRFEHSDVLSVLNLLIKQLETLHRVRRGGYPDPVNISKQLKVVWRKLFLSGPTGTHRSTMEEWLMRTVARLLSRLIQKVFHYYLVRAHIGQKTGKLTTIHGDLHCNNVLVSRDKRKVFFIDFENIIENSYWLLDLLYLWPMVIKLTKNRQVKRKVSKIAIRSVLFSTTAEQILFKRCLWLMRMAIFFNRRFGI